MFLNPDHDLDKLESALQASGVAWWLMELPSGVVFFSPNKSEMLGRKAGDFVHYKDFTKLLHKDDYPTAMKAMEDHISGKSDIYETVYRIKTAKGDYRTFYDRGRIVEKKNGEIKIAGVVLDVSSFALAEEALLKNAQ